MTDQNLQALTNERLHKLINETQETLNELKDEVERRIEDDQHDDISNLEEHMEHAELSLKTIRAFLSVLLNKNKH